MELTLFSTPPQCTITNPKRRLSDVIRRCRYTVSIKISRVLLGRNVFAKCLRFQLSHLLSKSRRNVAKVESDGSGFVRFSARKQFSSRFRLFQLGLFPNHGAPSSVLRPSSKDFDARRRANPRESLRIHSQRPSDSFT